MELGGWPYLRRECLLYETYARVYACQRDEGLVLLRRARAFLERMPSAWHSALLHRFEALLHVLDGRTAEARSLLEAALGTFSLTGDLCMSVYTRHLLALLARMEGDPAAGELLAASEAELRRVGMVVHPQHFVHHVAREPHATAREAEGAPRLGAEALVVPFERLSVRGMGAPSSSASCWPWWRGSSPTARPGWRSWTRRAGPRRWAATPPCPPPRPWSSGTAVAGGSAWASRVTCLRTAARC
ncbi:hypothetical protein QEG98_03515 [Myxococcus sp. MxC21-1]|uniref:hypothetical protein n=1 Tax=Myxococcus sp. MxC21-1 TaxID=3041439 RepID=UPI00293148EB|nr:hypothetical protein [Myxococcus sp. MxC21-1]WNZ62894.1 hypothetical protein QEG98_03515 [Myxococcus sp. MxC21-1]